MLPLILKELLSHMYCRLWSRGGVMLTSNGEAACSTRHSGLKALWWCVQLSDLICDADVDSDSPASEIAEAQTTTSSGCLSSFPLLERVITQVLPAVLVILWQNAIMPLVLYSLALFEKTHISLSAIDRRILMLFFYWNMFNVFFGAILAGSISQEVKHLINNPGDAGTTLGTSLPRSSNFFINYLALRAFGLVPFRLILVHGGIWRWLFKCAPWLPCFIACCGNAPFSSPNSRS